MEGGFKSLRSTDVRQAGCSRLTPMFDADVQLSRPIGRSLYAQQARLFTSVCRDAIRKVNTASIVLQWTPSSLRHLTTD